MTRLRIFIPTVGESYTLETIRRVKAFTPDPFEMTVWYESVGRFPKEDLIQSLKAECEDVILASRNHGLTEVLNFSMLCLHYDYLLILNADHWLEKDYWIKMRAPFDLYPKVACVGGWRSPMGDPLVLTRMTSAEGFSTQDAYPEGPLLISREAVDSVGALSCQFRGYGHSLYEWHMRCLAKGWNGIIVDKIFKEQGFGHVGRDMNPNVQMEVADSERVLAEIKKAGFQYDWWKSNVKESVVI